MKSIVFSITVILLSGCVGVSLQESDRVFNVNPENSFELRPGGGHSGGLKGDHKPWYTEKHPVNGTKKLISHTAWCGITLWALIPIPLKLPVCEHYMEATYVDNEPTSITVNLTNNYSFYACGPFMWISMGLVHGYEGNFLCGKTKGSF
jgi:hypothetical protein